MLTIPSFSSRIIGYTNIRSVRVIRVPHKMSIHGARLLRLLRVDSSMKRDVVDDVRFGFFVQQTHQFRLAHG